MHFEGDVIFGWGASLSAELSETVYDLLDVDALLSLDGTLDVVLFDAFDPELGDTFDILDWGTLNGAFHTVNLPSLSMGLNWDTSDLYGSGRLSVIPEPATIGLLALSSTVLLRRRRP